MIKKGFAKVWLALLVLILVVLVARLLFLNQNSPTLTQVLTQSYEKSSYDVSTWVVYLLAFSLAALSLAKGYEIIKRNKTVTSIVLPEEKSESADFLIEQEKDKEIGNMRQAIEALKKSNGILLGENEGLRGRTKQSAADFELLKQFEQSLRKSNISLGKECERLKSENEQLVLKVNSVKLSPKRTATRSTSKTRKKKAKGKTK